MSVTPEAVKELLQSDDYGDRLKAVNLIRELDLATGFELIQIAIADENVRVRYAAVSQLGTLGKHDPETSSVLLREQLLKDPEPDVQAAAADAIGALQLTAAFEELQALYHETDQWLVQFSIIATLGELGDPRALELLEIALQSDNELIKTAAIGSLAELGDRRVLTLLSPYATDPDWQIRYRVVQALGRLADPDSRAILEMMTQDEVESVAQEAKKHLSE